MPGRRHESSRPGEHHDAEAFYPMQEHHEHHEHHENRATTEAEGGEAFGTLAPGHNGTSPYPQTLPAPPYLELAVGGMVAKLRATPPPTPPLSKRAPTKKGTRGEVRGATRRSLARFREKVAAVNQKLHPVTTCAFLTLTYPASYPPEPEDWQADMKKLKRGLEERFVPMGAVVRKEFGRRGRPHFHAVVLLLGGVTPWEYTTEARRLWLEIAGDGSAANERHGVDGGPLRSWRAARAYLTKDGAMPTEEGTNRPRRTGRTWYVWRPELLGIAYRTIPLTGGLYLMLRRIFRRLARHSSGVSRLVGRDRFDSQTVMISEADALRLLEHLGVDTS